MGSLRTYILAAFLVAPPAAAETDLLRDFAACAGRYSATMEHDWLTGGDGMVAERRRALFVDLVDALRPGGEATGPNILAIRIDAKFAQARLLQLASFGTDPAARAPAARMAAAHLAQCDAFLLAG